MNLRSFPLPTPKQLSYFSARARLDSQFLHPGGRWGSEELIRLLADKLASKFNNAHVLEIGCGTGSTAQLLFEKFNITYEGVDGNPEMLARAKEKLARYGERAKLHHCDFRSGSLPDFVAPPDVVIAESVFAIVDTRAILRQCGALLKAGGTIALNDRIWSASASLEDRQRMNNVSEQTFGFPAAPDDLKDSQDWIKMIEQSGFKILAAERIDGKATRESGRGRFIAVLRKLGRIARRPSVLSALYLDYRASKEHQTEWKQMENWIFVATKIHGM
jgi:SAM-dependent methyltransferase